MTEAAEEGHAEVVRYLLSQGAEMNVAESEWNPLFAAIESGHLDVAQILLEFGINAKVSYSGPTVQNFDAYAFAMEQGQHEIAQLIKGWPSKEA